MPISIFYRESNLTVDVTTWMSGGNKRTPSIKQSWSKNFSGLLKYAGLSAPTRNKIVKPESYLLITIKTNFKSGPAWPTCYYLQKEYRNVTFFKQKKTYRPDETWLSEYFDLYPLIWFSRNTPPTVRKLFLKVSFNILIACFW